MERRLRNFGSAIAIAVFLLLMALNLGSPQVATGATITAKSVALADVSAAVRSAVDGDTVVIPPGRATWTIGLQVNVGSITIQGAGIGQTIITDNVPKAGGAANTVLMAFNTSAGKTFRLTGVSLYGQAQDVQNFNKGTLVLSGTSHSVRIDHVEFHRPGTSGIRFYNDVCGVVDHCTFDESNHKDALVVNHDGWAGGVFADGSFHDSLHLGTEKALYIEDCAFVGDGVAGAGVLDSTAGGRIVFRHNVVTSDNFVVHGTDSSGLYQGARSYEIYNNTFKNQNTLMFCAIYLRGGTGVIFNNTFIGGSGSSQTGYKDAILLANYRSDTANHYGPPWGMCTGSNPWDGNTDSLGYPALDQVGRGTQADAIIRDASWNPTNAATGRQSWPHQALEPLYEWSNNWTPVPNNPGSLTGLQQSIIQQNRDFFVGKPMPGYTPYTYPHPLTGSASMPAAPANLRIISH